MNPMLLALRAALMQTPLADDGWNVDPDEKFFGHGRNSMMEGEANAPQVRYRSNMPMRDPSRAGSEMEVPPIDPDMMEQLLKLFRLGA